MGYILRAPDSTREIIYLYYIDAEVSGAITILKKHFSVEKSC